MFTLLYTRDGQVRRHELTPGDTIVGRASICDCASRIPASRAGTPLPHPRRSLRADGPRWRNGTSSTANKSPKRRSAPVTRSFWAGFRCASRHSAACRTIFRATSTRSSTDRTAGAANRRRSGNGAGIQPAAHSAATAAAPDGNRAPARPWRPLPEILEPHRAVVFDTIAVERAFILLVDEADRRDRSSRRRARAAVTSCRNPTLSRTIIRRSIEERVAILVGRRAARVPVRLAAERAGCADPIVHVHAALEPDAVSSACSTSTTPTPLN